MTMRDNLMSKLKEMDAKLDTIQVTEANLQFTLVNPLDSVHAKMDTMDLKLDTTDGKFTAIKVTLDWITNLRS